MRSSLSIESDIIIAALSELPDPPVDLLRLAGALRVGRVVLAEIPSGSTDFSYSRPVIYLSNTASEMKRRFVFAHELAHVMLRDPKVVGVIQPRGQMKLLVDEEQLADRIASTLLLPDTWIDVLRKSRPLAVRLAEVARSAEVSLSVLVRRMSTAGIDVAMLHWVKGESEWHVVDRPGAPASLQGFVKPSVMGYWTIERARTEESDVVIDCRINGWPTRISGSIYRQGSSVLQIIEPSSDILASKYRECAS